jgi:hypothetical protein
MLPASRLLFLSPMLVACGAAAPTATSPQIDVSATAHVVPASASNDSPTEWARLVERELIWRRPDLDDHCGPSHSGYSIRTTTSDVPSATLSAALGCRHPANPAAGASPQPEFLETSYCCLGSRSAPMPHTAGAPTCEQAVENYRRAFRDSEPPPSDSTATQYGVILNRGSYFKHCSVADTTGIDICAAVINGQVVGVTVRTQPTAPSHADCVAAAVLQLAFPPNARMDVARTQF